MGDFNLDLLQYIGHLPTQEFDNSLFSQAFIPLISNPTCLTSHSTNLIDNIFTNCFERNIFSGIVINDMSDHFLVFPYFPHGRTKKRLKRSFNVSNSDNFK